MTQQPNGSVSDLPEALRLAEWLDETETDYLEPLNHVAAELRRLHEENQKFTHHQDWWQDQHDVTVEALLQANARINTLEEALRQAVEALKLCDSALSEELAAWDIDPPLHHVKVASDACGPAITAAKQALGETK